MKAFGLVLAAAFAAGGVVAALAAEKTITQKGKVFSETALAVKKGDALVFLNDDDVSHNIMSSSSGNEFNLGSQRPGMSTPVTFNKSGSVSVICAIHPRMKMAVTVTE
jgi:plastocyanin